MDALSVSGRECSWIPTPGAGAAIRPAGVEWDAVRAAGYPGDLARAVLGDRCGAVIRDQYGHRLFWFVGLGTAQAWEPPDGVDVYGGACWVVVLRIPPRAVRRRPR